MTWNLIAFGRAKWHLCPQELTQGILDDLEVRGHQGSLVDAKEWFRIDHGGPMWLGRSYHAVEIDGLRLEVPVAELARFLQELRGLEERGVNDQPYYKLHGWFHCIVLTPAQRDVLLAAWEAALPAVEVQAQADRMEFELRIRELNEHPNIKLSLPAKSSIPKGEN